MLLILVGQLESSGAKMNQAISYVVSKLQMMTTSDHTSVVSMNLFVALLCACIVIGHLLEESRWMNESTTALVIVSSLYFAFSLPGLV